MTAPGAGAVSWRETFTGWLGCGQTDFNQATLPPHRDRATAWLKLTIPDLDAFLAQQADGGLAAAPARPALVSGGEIECAGLGGTLTVDGGRFWAFVPASAAEPRDGLHLRMRYALDLRDPAGRPLTLEGFKLIENDPGYDSWSDTTTLFVTVRPSGRGSARGSDGARDSDSAWSSDSARGSDGARDGDGPGHAPPAPVAVGILRITAPALARELLSFRGTGPRAIDGVRSVARFQAFFLSSLARAYLGPPVDGCRPSFPEDATAPTWSTVRTSAADTADLAAAGAGSESAGAHAEAAGAGFTPLPGGRLARQVVPFTVPDLPFPLNLHRLRALGDDGAPVPPRRGPVLLVPGSGVRAEMYYGQPVGTSVAECLLAHGYDVWVESWRASIDLPVNSYTLDQAALIDHPRAVDTILDVCAREHPGDDVRLRAVVHCQGSISFMMAAVAGALDPRVTQIVSSAVSLFIDVTGATWLKQRLALPAVSRLFPGLDAQWGIRPITPARGLFAAAGRGLERPCGNPSCQVASFMYGSGWDVLVRHVGDDGQPWVAPLVHEWTGRELGYTPLSLIAQVAQSSRHGHIVPAAPGGPARPAAAPPSYFAAPPRTGAQVTFIAGDHNNMFRWQGQQRAKRYFDQTVGERRADFVVLPGFGHLDTFWGRHAPEVVYPVILDGLEWDGDGDPPSAAGGRRTTGGALPPRRGRLLGRRR